MVIINNNTVAELTRLNPTQQAGITKTQEITKIESKIRVKYNLKDNDSFDAPTAHEALLRELAKYTSLIIVPNNNDQEYNDLHKIPNDKLKFNDHNSFFGTSEKGSVVGQGQYNVVVRRAVPGAT